MIRHWRTKMMIVPLIFKVSRHIRHQKIAVSCIYLLVYSFVLCNNAHNRDGTLKTKLENFYDTFFEQRFLNKYFFNIFKISRVCC